MLPPSTAATPSSRPADTGSCAGSLYARTALIGRTGIRLELPRVVISASAIPNSKGSSRSPASSGLNGRTARESIAGSSGTEPSARRLGCTAAPATTGGVAGTDAGAGCTDASGNAPAVSTSVRAGAVRLSPSSPTSNAQARTAASGRPSATRTVTSVTDQAGTWRLGRTVEATWITTQPAIAYRNSTRITRRRRSSVRNCLSAVMLVWLWPHPTIIAPGGIAGNVSVARLTIAGISVVGRSASRAGLPRG